MSTRRTILNLLASLVEPNTKRRPRRVERRPLAEQLEPRALLSQVTLGAATFVRPRLSATAVVVTVKQNSSLSLENDIKDQINIENDVRRGS
jgi:hypothetical protein